MIRGSKQAAHLKEARKKRKRPSFAPADVPVPQHQRQNGGLVVLDEAPVAVNAPALHPEVRKIWDVRLGSGTAALFNGPAPLKIFTGQSLAQQYRKGMIGPGLERALKDTNMGVWSMFLEQARAAW
jgi:hypothetical protein